MITWIQKYFAKHFKIVFSLILIAVAVPLVLVYSESSNSLSASGTKSLERPFFSRNLGNEGQARQIFTDGNLSAQLKAGYGALQGAQLQQYSLQRIAGLALADELHLPVPNPDQVANYVLTLRAFQDEQGRFDQKRYNEFGDRLKTGGQISTAEVNRVLRDDARLEALSKVIGGPGYVVAHDIRQELIRADSSWTVQIATLDYAAFNPVIATTDEILKKFYDDNIFRYEVPARPRLSLVEFKGEEFIPPVAPTEAELRAFYNANSASFPVPADATEKKDAPMALTPAAPVDNFPKVRAQVETALKNLVGGRGASKAANDLTIALYERKLSANSAELAAFLAAQRRAPRAIAPFAPDSPPADMAWLANHADQISRLSQERFFSDPLPTGDSFVVLLWNESLPAYRPMMVEVRDRVATDYKEGEKRKRFIERGRALRAQLQAAAKSADGFTSAATAEKLEVKSYANFTFRQPPQDLPYQAFSALQGLETGQVSDMVAGADKGYLVYAQEKKLPELSPANPRYAELQKQLMAFTASSNENSYLGELVERELKKTEPLTP